MVSLPKGDPTECGSIASYMRHRRKGEPACAPCKAAWRRYFAAYRALGRKPKKDGTP
jgi:hypothetical protein